MTRRRGDPAGGPAGVVPATPAGCGDGAADDRAVQPERAVLQPLAGRPRPAGDAGRAHPARDQRLAGRAGGDVQAPPPPAPGCAACAGSATGWSTGEGLIDGIGIPSPPDRPVPILTDDEIAALPKSVGGRPGIFDRTVFLGRRDEVVRRLLLDTGVRVPELCGLELTDVDLDRELAYITGKGSRPRVVPFGAKTAQAVDRYLRVRSEEHTSELQSRQYLVCRLLLEKKYTATERMRLSSRSSLADHTAHSTPPVVRSAHNPRCAAADTSRAWDDASDTYPRGTVTLRA